MSQFKYYSLQPAPQEKARKNECHTTNAAVTGFYTEAIDFLKKQGVPSTLSKGVGDNVIATGVPIDSKVQALLIEHAKQRGLQVMVVMEQSPEVSQVAQNYLRTFPDLEYRMKPAIRTNA